MRKVVIERSYPMDINGIIYDEWMSYVGLYYITRNFGGNITDSYIGKIAYNFKSRLESHMKNCLGDHRGIIQVWLGYIVSPQNITVQWFSPHFSSTDNSDLTAWSVSWFQQYQKLPFSHTSCFC